MTADWLRLLSPARRTAPADPVNGARSAFQRDHDRVLFSGPFRRMADKTQVFPLPYDDHVHSRLTHSLEVAAVGRSLGTLVGRRILAASPSLKEHLEDRDFGDCVAAACLAHDLGNPPFGHVGEEAIQEFFGEYFAIRPAGGFAADLAPDERTDFTRFEGNAQTFRIVTRLERPLRGGGLDLSRATLGALLKYPCASAVADRESKSVARKKHGAVVADLPRLAEAAEALGLARDPGGAPAWRRHPLAFLTEAADDIAYHILDLEDGYRLGHVGTTEYRDLMLPLCATDAEVAELSEPRSYNERLDQVETLRARVMDRFIHEAGEAFLTRLPEILSGAFDEPLAGVIGSRAELRAIRKVCFAKCYKARDVLKMELAGTEAIQGLLHIFTRAFEQPRSIRAQHLSRLLPALFEDVPAYERLLRLTDHVSGMTDHYAVRRYRELRGMRYPGGRD